MRHARPTPVWAVYAVRGECLKLVLRNWGIGQFGVWGGTSR